MEEDDEEEEEDMKEYRCGTSCSDVKVMELLRCLSSIERQRERYTEKTHTHTQTEHTH